MQVTTTGPSEVEGNTLVIGPFLVAGSYSDPTVNGWIQ